MKPQPDIRPVKESGDLYRLMADFSYTDRGQTITVPGGFRMDGASSPRWAWSLTGFGRDGIHRAAALIHDWIYVNKGRMKGGTDYTRKEADRLFYQMLKDYGVKSWHARLAYIAVRVGGGFYWKE